MLPQSGLFKQREGVGGILPNGGNGKYRCGIILSLVPNSNLKLKINIFILELSMLFSKEYDFILHTSNRILTFLRKTDISHIFHCFISLYDTQFIFFQKQRKLLSQTNLIFSSFTLGSKLNFLADFIKNKKYKKGLKYFAKIKF